MESIAQLEELCGKGDRYRQLINYLERGTKQKPPSFAAGVSQVIESLRRIGETS